MVGSNFHLLTRDFLPAMARAKTIKNVSCGGSRALERSSEPSDEKPAQLFQYLPQAQLVERGRLAQLKRQHRLFPLL